MYERVAADDNNWKAGNIQMMLIMPELNLEWSGNNDKQATICKLRHPKTGQSALYFFSDDNQKIMELIVFDENHRSWFIGETVQRDGCLYVASPIDPVFLVLPYLMKAAKSGKFMQLECILEDPEFPESRRLSISQLDDLDLVAEVKGISDSSVYRFSKDKTLSWLQVKCDRVAKALMENGVSVSRGALLSTFTRSNKQSNEESQENYLRYASGLIAEYLDAELAEEFLKQLGISPLEECVKDESTVDDTPATKKSKMEILAPTEDYSQAISTSATKAKKLTTAQKQLSKVDKAGIKSISSFFGQGMKKK